MLLPLISLINTSILCLVWTLFLIWYSHYLLKKNFVWPKTLQALHNYWICLGLPTLIGTFLFKPLPLVAHCLKTLCDTEICQKGTHAVLVYCRQLDHPPIKVKCTECPISATARYWRNNNLKVRSHFGKILNFFFFSGFNLSKVGENRLNVHPHIHRIRNFENLGSFRGALGSIWGLFGSFQGPFGPICGLFWPIPGAFWP